MRSVSRTTVVAAAALGLLLAGGCAQPGTGSGAGNGGGTDDGAGQTAIGGSGPDDPTSNASGGQPSTTTPAPAAPIPAELTVTVDDGSGNTSTYSLTCVPAGGDHPDPDAACAGLAAAGTDVFGPPDPDVACTEIYGGPQTATVTGQVAGSRVNSSFGRTNGCQIARWDALSEVFANAGGGN